jgi:hypothetical protein
MAHARLRRSVRLSRLTCKGIELRTGLAFAECFVLMALTLMLTACGGGNSTQEEKANEVHHISEDSQVYDGAPLSVGRYATVPT